MTARWIPPIDRSKFVSNMMGNNDPVHNAALQTRACLIRFSNKTLSPRFSFVARCGDNDADVWISHRFFRMAIGFLCNRYDRVALEHSLVFIDIRLSSSAPENLRRRTSIHRRCDWLDCHHKGNSRKIRLNFSAMGIYAFPFSAIDRSMEVHLHLDSSLGHHCDARMQRVRLLYRC